MAPKVNSSSKYLVQQQELQRELKCDYALVHYDKDPSSQPPSPGKPPAYVAVSKPIPVKLSHQIYMQMSFGILRDRLSSNTLCQSTGVDRDKDLIAMFLFLSKFIHEMERNRQRVEGQHSPKLFSTQYLRFQLLLEYGKDVKALMDAIPHDDATMQRYWDASVTPVEVTEEEVLKQMSRPSGMAQECAMM